MPTNQNNIRIDDEVFKLQSIIEAGSNALETFQDNAQKALAQESLVNILHLAMEDETFRKSFVNTMVNQIGSSRIIRDIVASSKDDIREAINARVQSHLTTEALAPVVSQILNMVSNGQLPELPDIMNNPRIEDLTPDSVENIRKILEIRAGDKAWK